MIMILLYIVLLSYRRTLTKTAASRLDLDALVAAFYVHLSTTANPSKRLRSKVEGMPLERLY